jgi:hypothetical protein
MSSNELREVQRRHRALLRSCYERQRLSATAGTSKAEVSLKLGPGGRVSKVVVDAGGDAQLAVCLERIIRSWRFSADLRPQEVAFPLVFGGSTP